MLGKVLGHYEVGERLGEGGSGVVYRARDLRLERDVAIKVLNDECRNDELGWARLLREARLASCLSHPHIVSVYDLGEEDGNAFVIMEYVEGLPLSDVIPDGGLSWDLLRRYGSEIAEALAYAHQQGVVHGDLKGSNVLINSQGSTKLVDFGLGRRVPRSGTDQVTSSHLALADAGATAGTLPYLAPEVLRGEWSSIASDCWALGVLLHQMATGDLPFQGQTPFDLSVEIMVAAPRKLGQIPEPLRSAVQRCLEKDAAARCSSAGEVAAALRAEPEPVAAAAIEVPSPEAGSERSANRWRWRRWVQLGAAALMAALVVGILLMRPKPVARHLIANPTDSGVNTAFGTGDPAIRVWVNTRSQAYHCPGTPWYGHTQQGEYMTQKDAQSKGYRPAANRACL